MNSKGIIAIVTVSLFVLQAVTSVHTASSATESKRKSRQLGIATVAVDALGTPIVTTQLDAIGIPSTTCVVGGVVGQGGFLNNGFGVVGQLGTQGEAIGCFNDLNSLYRLNAVGSLSNKQYILPPNLTPFIVLPGLDGVDYFALQYPPAQSLYQLGCDLNGTMMCYYYYYF